MYRDEIIVEVWRNRDAYTALHHYSFDEMVADLQVRQQRPDCKLVDRRKTSQHPQKQLSELAREALRKSAQGETLAKGFDEI